MSELHHNQAQSDRIHIQKPADHAGESTMRSVVQDHLTQYQNGQGTDRAPWINSKAEPSGHLDLSADIYGSKNIKAGDKMAGPHSKEASPARTDIGDHRQDISRNKSSADGSKDKDGHGANYRSESPQDQDKTAHPATHPRAADGKATEPQADSSAQNPAASSKDNQSDTHSTEADGRKSNGQPAGSDSSTADGAHNPAIGHIRVGDGGKGKNNPESTGEDKSEHRGDDSTHESAEKKQTDKDSWDLLSADALKGDAHKAELAHHGVTTASAAANALAENGNSSSAVLKGISGGAEKLAPYLEGAEAIGKLAPYAAGAMYIGAGIQQARNGDIEGGSVTATAGIAAVEAGVACGEAGSLASPFVGVAAGVSCALGTEMGLEKGMEKGIHALREYAAGEQRLRQQQTEFERGQEKLEALMAQSPHVTLRTYGQQ